MASFSNQPGFEDIIPIPQDDGPNPVVSITYSNSFKELMNLFRAILKIGEKSQRVLQLTEDLLELNPANYTIWQYRRQVLFELQLNLQDELDYMDTFAEENPKNYQIWYHRRAIVEKLNDPSRELAFTATVFQVDAKNYHAWAYRQWVISYFQLWEGELEYTTSLINEDIRNNSAWNQRWFALHSSGATTFKPVDESALESDIEFTFQIIQKAVSNESAWNYLHGLRNKYQNIHPVIISLNLIDRLIELLELFDREGVNDCNYLYEHVADIWYKEGTQSIPINSEKIQKAAELFGRLSEIDTIRKKYWEKRVSDCQLQISAGLLIPLSESPSSSDKKKI